jgi:hypothetical protein
MVGRPDLILPQVSVTQRKHVCEGKWNENNDTSANSFVMSRPSAARPL